MPDDARDDAPLADEPAEGAIPNDQPASGLPDRGSPEPTPLGNDDPPEKQGEPAHGAEAMPGIPTDGEPDNAG